MHETGRVCEEPECETVLSIYNATGWCWQHEQPHAYVLQAPRKRRKDAKDTSPDTPGPSPEARPGPGPGPRPGPRPGRTS